MCKEAFMPLHEVSAQYLSGKIGNDSLKTKEIWHPD